MESIGIRELRQHASRYVAAAREGKAFVVTDRMLEMFKSSKGVSKNKGTH